MRHLKTGRKLNRKPAHRLALMRALAGALFEHEAIVTTKPKAKEAQRWAERLITVAKRGGGDKDRTLFIRRLVASRLQNEVVARKLCEEIAPRFADRPGGYTRILKLARIRKGDGGSQVRLELTEIRKKKVEESKDKKKKEAAKK